VSWEGREGREEEGRNAKRYVWDLAAGGDGVFFPFSFAMPKGRLSERLVYAGKREDVRERMRMM